jgi:hypothetical protein
MSATATRQEPMVRRNDQTVKIDAEVMRKAKIVASFKDMSLAEYISEALRPIVENELQDFARRTVNSQLDTPKDKPPPKR